MTDEITIQGMGCEHCVTAVREALEKVHGVDVAHVEIGAARVRAEDGRVPREAIDAAIREAGYEPVSHTETTA